MIALFAPRRTSRACDNGRGLSGLRLHLEDGRRGGFCLGVLFFKDEDPLVRQ